MQPPPVVLSVAGSDPSGGAGLQADLKTFATHRVYGAAVVTLLTVQNTTAVRRVQVIAPDLVAEQIDAVVEDLAPRAIKTGALGNAAVVRAVAERLARVGVPLVVDPVAVSKHGAPLLEPDAVDALRTKLVPIATLVTPNAAEAAQLSGRPVRDIDDALRAAEAIAALGPRAVLVKGGHFSGEPHDVLLENGRVTVLHGRRVATQRTHGTGCALSAAIAARLARGEPLADAVERAKRWLERALVMAPPLGHGIGPPDLAQPPP
ncbi:MAG: bifunctional hydroxymethylpyrimidine kinase/phosphomethylpyrimidine kinase [Myxococcota bacterium]|nr:bifunctional hydroxymethylpyrimidine kinase/phosphomethylpyrimidine kinase [Myxococcota bacterium]